MKLYKSAQLNDHLIFLPYTYKDRSLPWNTCLMKAMECMTYNYFNELHLYMAQGIEAILKVEC